MSAPCPLGCDEFGGHEVFRLPHYFVRMDGQPRPPVEPEAEPCSYCGAVHGPDCGLDGYRTLDEHEPL